mmetsp:Transcript_32897/g.92379  ORF Transcript_32897/g.92379 Transcript_32897/m.92379 type:complete len:353 (-) Transcript_32897:405-1463(-)
MWVPRLHRAGGAPQREVRVQGGLFQPRRPRVHHARGLRAVPRQVSERDVLPEHAVRGELRGVLAAAGRGEGLHCRAAHRVPGQAAVRRAVPQAPLAEGAGRGVRRAGDPQGPAHVFEGAGPGGHLLPAPALRGVPVPAGLALGLAALLLEVRGGPDHGLLGVLPRGRRRPAGPRERPRGRRVPAAAGGHAAAADVQDADAAVGRRPEVSRRHARQGSAALPAPGPILGLLLQGDEADRPGGRLREEDRLLPPGHQAGPLGICGERRRAELGVLHGLPLAQGQHRRLPPGGLLLRVRLRHLPLRGRDGQERRGPGRPRAPTPTRCAPAGARGSRLVRPAARQPPAVRRVARRR